jgi:hypothetical protein
MEPKLLVFCSIFLLSYVTTTSTNQLCVENNQDCAANPPVEDEIIESWLENNNASAQPWLDWRLNSVSN